MADISEHFSKKDFRCPCDKCRGSVKMSMTLIGILELIRTHFNQRVNIINAYRCPDKAEELGRVRKSYHARGQAVDFTVSNVPLEDVFLFAETIPQINGLGFYPAKQFVHIDVREAEKADKWVYEDDYMEITEARKRKYNLIPKENFAENSAASYYEESRAEIPQFNPEADELSDTNKTTQAEASSQQETIPSEQPEI